MLIEQEAWGTETKTDVWGFQIVKSYFTTVSNSTLSIAIFIQPLIYWQWFLCKSHRDPVMYLPYETMLPATIIPFRHEICNDVESSVTIMAFCLLHILHLLHAFAGNVTPIVHTWAVWKMLLKCYKVLSRQTISVIYTWKWLLFRRQYVKLVGSYDWPLTSERRWQCVCCEALSL